MSSVIAKFKGTKERPRASVLRSNTALYVQFIDDSVGKTLISGSTSEIKEKKTPTEKAFMLGELLAKRAKENKIGAIIYDRGKRKYHGQVKAAAEGMRAGGIKF